MNTPSNGYYQPPGGYYVFVIEYNTGIRRVHADPSLVCTYAGSVLHNLKKSNLSACAGRPSHCS